MDIAEQLLGSPGAAPATFTPVERGAWREILARALPGAYTARERPFLEVAARQLAMHRLAGGDDAEIAAHARRFLRNLGFPDEAIVELLKWPDELPALQ